jgi:hypothetical protein
MRETQRFLATAPSGELITSIQPTALDAQASLIFEQHLLCSRFTLALSHPPSAVHQSRFLTIQLTQPSHAQGPVFTTTSTSTLIVHEETSPFSSAHSTSLLPFTVRFTLNKIEFMLPRPLQHLHYYRSMTVGYTRELAVAKFGSRKIFDMLMYLIRCKMIPLFHFLWLTG